MLLPLQIKTQVSVNININTQPDWAPIDYDYVEYYYIPNLEIYYNVKYQKYIYFDNGKWIWVRALPARYAYYNFYTGYKVVINESQPYLHFKTHKVKYAKYKNHYGKQKPRKDYNHNRNSPRKIHHSSPQKSHKGGGNGHGGRQGKGHK